MVLLNLFMNGKLREKKIGLVRDGGGVLTRLTAHF